MSTLNLTLLTDLYEITMMQGYFKSGKKDFAVFDAFYRKNPCDGGYAICAGLEQVIDYIEHLHFDADDIAYLRSLKIFDEDFLAYLKKLEEKKPVIFCGDLNVAHKEIDLKNPKTNRKNAGFTDEEREKFSQLLDAGFIDTFRYFYPEQEGIYSWWSYRFKAREKNAGWRIDYFCVSECLKEKLQDAKIHTEIMGSDHCPVELDIG